MRRTNIQSELHLQQYLTRKQGENLREIEPSLELLETEHKFESGRIDIIARKDDVPVGIELKAANYQTRAICAQLMNYLNYISRFNGTIYFIAPKIKYGIYSTLKEHYDQGRLKFFEVQKRNESYSFKEIIPQNIDDRRPLEELDYIVPNSTLESRILEEKLKKGIDILIRDKRKASLAKNIIDNEKERTKYYEDIAENVIDIVEKSTKNRSLSTIYRLLRLF